MLRIISSKVAVAPRTPGNLSMPNTDDQVLQPYRTMTRFVRDQLQRRKRDQMRNRTTSSPYEYLRNPANGVCSNCGNFNAKSQRGNIFCPTCR